VGHDECAPLFQLTHAAVAPRHPRPSPSQEPRNIDAEVRHD
jgi:hypothetical protein